MKKGRRKDHLWRFVEYDKGPDLAIYARCSCGYMYSCCKVEHPFRVIIDKEKMYPYCPYCGARKTRYDPEVKKINWHPGE